MTEVQHKSQEGKCNYYYAEINNRDQGVEEEQKHAY